MNKKENPKKEKGIEKKNKKKKHKKEKTAAQPGFCDGRRIYRLSDI
jgi:hypothetical protein